jgi:hypothetical protein
MTLSPLYHKSIRFVEIIAFEKLCADKAEIPKSGFILWLTKSKFLSYILKYHGRVQDKPAPSKLSTLKSGC